MEGTIFEKSADVPAGATVATFRLVLYPNGAIMPELTFTVPPSNVAFTVQFEVDDDEARAQIRALVVGKDVTLTVE